MDKRVKIIILLLRIIFGLMFLYSGLSKFFGDFSAAGYLTNAVSGPFAEYFNALAGSTLVDLLVIWGETLIGVSLIFGIFLRFASFWGIVMMLLFYLSVFPPEHGPVSEHIVYILVFLLLASSGAGRNFGLDELIERQKLVKKIGLFKYILG